MIRASQLALAVLAYLSLFGLGCGSSSAPDSSVPFTDAGATDVATPSADTAAEKPDAPAQPADLADKPDSAQPADATADKAPACPDAYPEYGTSCTGSLACAYDVDPAGCPSRLTAACADGWWKAPYAVGCPLAAGATCDPRGEWRIEAGAFSHEIGNQSQWESSVASIRETIVDANGLLVAYPQAATFDPATCRLSISDVLQYTTLPQQYGGGYVKVTADWKIDLQGDSGTGTLRIASSGEAAGLSTAAVTAKRISK